eukprot:507780_1
MYSLLYFAITVVIVHSNTSDNVELGLCSVAIAQFNGSYGVTGFASVDQDGTVIINLDVSGLDASRCADNGVDGFRYHIHNKWTHDSTDNRYEFDCSPPYTSGHFNPYQAPICSQVEDPGYYDCEVGDLSGRFGFAIPDANGKISIHGFVASLYCGSDCGAKLNPEAVAGKSMVFHCHDGPRIFCAGFDTLISS